ncbi:MAG: hypothetical protein MI862_09730, partial [Desulfobacterales bacterium]|nr:hypothetical protein [Desulfobacterales bacterium]
PSYLSFYPYSSLGKGLHSSLCAPFPALNTNKNSAQYVKVISTRRLSAAAAQHNLSDSGRNQFNGIDTWKQCNDPLSAKDLPEL